MLQFTAAELLTRSFTKCHVTPVSSLTPGQFQNPTQGSYYHFMEPTSLYFRVEINVEYEGLNITSTPLIYQALMVFKTKEVCAFEVFVGTFSLESRSADSENTTTRHPPVWTLCSFFYFYFHLPHFYRCGYSYFMLFLAF